MRLISFDDGGIARVGIVEGEQVREAGSSLLAPSPGERTWPWSEVRLLPPVRPASIVCVGLNYRDHAAESGVDLPAAPLLFAKLPSSVAGPGEDIVIPSIT
ncbi:MAG TPA: Rv2993c-like domain-containing protein, partial [Actinomycetota bacterium]